MASSTEARPLRQDLRAIFLDGLAWSLMVGVGEMAFPAFALALGLAPLWVGLVATVPMVIGALAQLPTVAWVRRIGSHRRYVVLCAAIQAASFVPLAVVACHGSVPGWVLYGLVSIYWAAGLATAPAWNTWVETLIPARARTRYFAWRNRYLYVVQIAGLVAAGLVLDAGARGGVVLVAFAGLFALAAVARAVSTGYLASQSEPIPIPAGMREVSTRELVARFRHAHDGRLIVYVLAMQVAYQVSLPFFLPYMLDALGWSYAEAMTAQGALVLSKFALLPAFGRFASRRGTAALLSLGGAALVPAGVLWFVSADFAWILGAQVLTGAAFAAFELASFLLYFETIEIRERTSVLTTFNLANALAILVGSLVGGAVLQTCGSGREAFLAVFAASTVLRVATLPLLGRVGPGKT